MEQTRARSASAPSCFAISQGLRWSMYWFARSANAMISRMARLYSRAS